MLDGTGAVEQSLGDLARDPFVATHGDRPRGDLGIGLFGVVRGGDREDGAHTGEGNRRFDEGLRAENPAWGVRDTAEIGAMAAAAGLSPAARVAMPANNRLLIFRRA